MPPFSPYPAASQQSSRRAPPLSGSSTWPWSSPTISGWTCGWTVERFSPTVGLSNFDLLPDDNLEVPPSCGVHQVESVKPSQKQPNQKCHSRRLQDIQNISCIQLEKGKKIQNEERVDLCGWKPGQPKGEYKCQYAIPANQPKNCQKLRLGWFPHLWRGCILTAGGYLLRRQAGAPAPPLIIGPYSGRVYTRTAPHRCQLLPGSPLSESCRFQRESWHYQWQQQPAHTIPGKLSMTQNLEEI